MATKTNNSAEWRKGGGEEGREEEGVARGVLGQLTEPEEHSPWAQNPWRIARDKRG